MTMITKRILAALAVAFVAALTGIAVGVLGSQDSCRVTTTTPATAGPAPSASAPSSGDDRLGNAGAPASAATAPVSCETERNILAPATTATVGALLAGLVMALLTIRGDRGDRSAGQQPPVPATPGGQAEADRAALVAACVYVRDRITSRALGDRLGSALASAGVRTLEPTGVPFDAARHEAGGTTPTDDPAVAGTVAAVEVPGYADRDGRLLRAPVVTVYRATTPGGEHR